MDLFFLFSLLLQFKVIFNLNSFLLHVPQFLWLTLINFLWILVRKLFLKIISTLKNNMVERVSLLIDNFICWNYFKSLIIIQEHFFFVWERTRVQNKVVILIIQHYFKNRGLQITLLVFWGLWFCFQDQRLYHVSFHCGGSETIQGHQSNFTFDSNRSCKSKEFFFGDISASEYS